QLLGRELDQAEGCALDRRRQERVEQPAVVRLLRMLLLMLPVHVRRPQGAVERTVAVIMLYRLLRILDERLYLMRGLFDLMGQLVVHPVVEVFDTRDTHRVPRPFWKNWKLVSESSMKVIVAVAVFQRVVVVMVVHAGRSVVKTLIVINRGDVYVRHSVRI